MTLQLRAHGVRQALRGALGGPVTRVHLRSFGTDWISYFNAFGPVQIEHEGHLWLVSMGTDLRETDILLLLSHGSDLSQRIWALKAKQPDLLVGVWMFDNHIAHLPNLRTVTAADFYFPSHDFITDYLQNPWSIQAAHVPLCMAQWSAADLADIFSEAGDAARSNELYAAYVDYPALPRSAFLRAIPDHIPCSTVKLMAHDARHTFFGMTKRDQLREWFRYKVSVCAPVSHDLSTRFFDGLACGQVVIVSDAIADLDIVVPPEVQRELPVLRYGEGDHASLRNVAAEALARYDAEGMRGVLRRHRFVMTGHLIMNRVRTMLGVLAGLDRDQLLLVFDHNKGGLRCQPRAPH
jgi:hypothetical protein